MALEHVPSQQRRYTVAVTISSDEAGGDVPPASEYFSWRGGTWLEVFFSSYLPVSRSVGHIFFFSGLGILLNVEVTLKGG